MEDKFIRDIFSSYNPSMGSSEQYMVRLEKRLEAVEYVKQYANSRRRYYRLLVMAAFVIGLILGVGSAIYLWTNPKVTFSFMDIISIGVDRVQQGDCVKVVFAGAITLLIAGMTTLFVAMPQRS